jgi:hypothetical protein
VVRGASSPRAVLRSALVSTIADAAAGYPTDMTIAVADPMTADVMTTTAAAAVNLNDRRRSIVRHLSRSWNGCGDRGAVVSRE